MSEKQIKAAIKEGGKKGQDLAGINDMGGISFFTLSMETPDGNMELLEKVMEGANKEVDEAAEERKGGSGHIAKAFLSSGEQQLAILIDLPPEQKEKIDKAEWMDRMLKAVGAGEVIGSDDRQIKALVKKEGEVFPIKARDVAIAASFAFLREKELVPPPQDDDDWDPSADSGLEW
uniref:Uncharacterized protein n=1 Tax=Chromera velia CCMP2878 TaxID=1169474 RepID=A0A0G4GR00_9ALVE|mmetsp:Transcript_6344/g.12598  ORF Transcript_6344/g.12598 Transcript_6344/m.12598 type:complete len:176 (-) Transcript_6344:653-1180(-)|eukprot:Cvel_22936.t1-p1 / transcript=Cvel_22936.t1 / gene=Cvel_22936 / organism=Chromera_velia_CCMP2878 / gene_product=hypothetical protein / transcript_product=hypothetical protein / location=Cvel_scaffold2308:4876-5400(-) / protein_length=175 / sequence_SO=supercontig / SO=protein_coding / is_pseudo=false